MELHLRSRKGGDRNRLLQELAAYVAANPNARVRVASASEQGAKKLIADLKKIVAVDLSNIIPWWPKE